MKTSIKSQCFQTVLIKSLALGFIMCSFSLPSFLVDFVSAQLKINATLCRPITVGHSNFLELLLILIVRINVDHINFQAKATFSERKK